MNKSSFDLHDELIVERVGQGVQLLHPDEKCSFQSMSSIENLMKAPFHIYFMDKNSVLKKFNERGATTFNLNDYQDAIGLTARDFSSQESAEYSIANDRKVIHSNTLLTCDESYTRLDGIDFTTLSMKFPWYDGKNTILGVFGFSFLLDEKWGVSLASAMNQIFQTGLLNSKLMPSMLPGFQYGEIYFSKRQKEIISQMIRGKTAKEIAAVLSLSTRTVEHHIENIKFKTDSSSKSELIDKIIDYFM